MIALHRCILRLETAEDRRAFRHLGDEELDAALAAELRRWIAADPDACPAELCAEALAFVEARDLRGRRDEPDAGGSDLWSDSTLHDDLRRWRHLLPGGASRQRRGRPGSVRAV